MLSQRNVLLSYRALIKSRLESTSYGLTNGFNVYGETEIRRGTSVVAPAIYLIVDRIVPTEVTLPFIALQVVNARNMPLELGTTNGRRRELRAHIYARSIGQRDDLAEYLADPDVIFSVDIYDYNDSPPTYIETGKIDIAQTLNVAPTVDEAQNVEGSWRWRRIVRHVLVTTQ